MENNIIKESQLEVLSKNEITTIVNMSNLPVARNRSDLLPTVIKNNALALVEIKKEFYNVKKHRSIYGLTWFIKSIIVLCAKLARFMFLSASRLVSFVMFSAILLLSTAIITKNVVNFVSGIKLTDVEDKNKEFSIYSVKDDAAAKAKAERVEQLEK